MTDNTALVLGDEPATTTSGYQADAAGGGTAGGGGGDGGREGGGRDGSGRDYTARPAVGAVKDYVDLEESALSRFHEESLEQGGYGRLQMLLFLLLGLALAADTVELMLIAYILPSAERDLCMDDMQKAWLGSITFLGMMVGSLVWGTLADGVGRRRTLLLALCINTLFAVVAAFMPTYGLFMMCRFFSGVGIGGSLPLVFAYYCEFLTQPHRGWHMSLLLTWWPVGALYAALLAYAIIPYTIVLPGQALASLTSWRVYLLVCAIPVILSIFGLHFMPESPRFLLEAGREAEALTIYHYIYHMNGRDAHGSELQLTTLELPPRQAAHTSTHSLTSNSGGKSNLTSNILTSVETFWTSLLQLFFTPLLKMTFTLLLIWFCAMFGFYGLSIWFPEYIRQLEEAAYTSQRSVVDSESFQHTNYSGTLENVLYNNCHFRDATFTNLLLSHVTFANTTFTSTTFNHVLSSRLSFLSCHFVKVAINDSDFYVNRFHHSTLDAASNITNLKPGCQLDFDATYDLKEVLHQTLITQAPVIPVCIMSAFIMDRLGRRLIAIVGLTLSSCSAFFIWFLHSPPGTMAFQTIFNCVIICAWNAIDILTTEVYPAAHRTTAYGLLSSLGRIAGILGMVTFGASIGVSKTIPMLVTAAVLGVGALTSIRLPETKDVLI